MAPARVLGVVVALATAFFLLVMVPGVGERQATMGGSSFYTVGPSALPYLAGTMTLIFSVMVAVMAKPVVKPEAAGVGVDEPTDPADSLKRGLVFIGLFAAYAVGMLYVGFLLASALFLASVFLIFRVRSRLVAAILVVLLPFVTDSLLRNVFLVPLPSFPYW